jgi:hypothetical protein
MLDALASETSLAGDRLQTRRVSDLRVRDQRVLPTGVRIEGRGEGATAGKQAGGRERRMLRFDTQVAPAGFRIPIEVSCAEEGKSQTQKDATTLGGAAAGAVVSLALDRPVSIPIFR